MLPYNQLMMLIICPRSAGKGVGVVLQWSGGRMLIRCCPLCPMVKIEFRVCESAFSEFKALQNPLQKGFTKGTSATVASLLFTEAVAAVRDTRTTLYAACIDVSKAFDFVCHKSLLRKFYNLGLTGKCWNILQDSYHEMSSVVNWCGKHSRPFFERQGVRQGGIISPTGYKIQTDPLLYLLQRMRVGLTIGTVHCGVPTEADDLLYLSRSIIEHQAILITQGYFVGLKRYIISDTKTKFFIVHSPVDTDTKLKFSQQMVNS